MKGDLAILHAMARQAGYAEWHFAVRADDGSFVRLCARTTLAVQRSAGKQRGVSDWADCCRLCLHLWRQSPVPLGYRRGW